VNYVWVSDVSDDTHTSATQRAEGDIKPSAARSKTLLSRWAQDRGAISSSWRAVSSIDLCVLLATFPFTILVLFGTISFLSFALGAKTP